MNVIEAVEAVVARERVAASTEWDRVRIQRAIESLPGVDASDASARRWFEYELEVEARPEVEVEAGILSSLRSLDVAAAPEVAAIIPFETGSVIVRRYWACPGERLVPARAMPGPFAEAARARFRRDMGELVAHGKIHPYIRGLAHWFVSERTHTIVLNRWSVLIPATPRQQAEFLESVDHQLVRGA